MQAVTYSFLSVLAAIVGPGGSFNLGTGSGNADEGISIEPSEDLDQMTIGADGSVMHSLHADRSGKLVVRLLKTSPTNALLGAMLALQRQSAANHGQNTLTVADSVRGDVITCQNVAFAKVPTITYAKDGGMNEWHFNAGQIAVGLGGGL
jgi:hypothetical protein